MRLRLSFSNRRGFSLPELMVVVAVVGVLATLGVPVFRRMVQKSKKTEAKVNLAGVYTAESAFKSEYNYFGNNITKMGFEVDGSASTLIYTVGFFDDGCVAAAVEPSEATAKGAITAAYPEFYTQGSPRTGQITPTVATVCGDATTLSGVVGSAGGVAGSSFKAAASGMIGPPAILRSAATIDIWTMDSARNLTNVQDGIQ